MWGRWRMRPARPDHGPAAERATAPVERGESDERGDAAAIEAPEFRADQQ